MLSLKKKVNRFFVCLLPALVMSRINSLTGTSCDAIEMKFILHINRADILKHDLPIISPRCCVMF